MVMSGQVYAHEHVDSVEGAHFSHAHESPLQAESQGEESTDHTVSKSESFAIFDSEESSSSHDSEDSRSHFHCCSVFLYAYLPKIMDLQPLDFFEMSPRPFSSSLKPGPWLDGPFYPPRKT